MTLKQQFNSNMNGKFKRKMCNFSNMGSKNKLGGKISF